MTGKKSKQMQHSLAGRFVSDGGGDCYYYTNKCSCGFECGDWTPGESEELFAIHLKPKYYPLASEMFAVGFRDAGLGNFKRLVNRKFLQYNPKLGLLTYNRRHRMTFDTKEDFDAFFDGLKQNLLPFDNIDLKNK